MKSIRTTYSNQVFTFPCFTKEQVTTINKEIKNHEIQKEESISVADNVDKKGDFFNVPCAPLMNFIHPWLYSCQLSNIKYFNYDIYWNFHLESLNYNVYGENGTYGWHIDEAHTVAYDHKLTCILNLSEEPYEGGEFYTISQNEEHKFTSGMGIILNSMLAHKVTPVTKGERITLSYWASGPSWR